MNKTITTTDLAEFLGITTRRLRQLAAGGIIKKTARGRFPFKESVKKYYEYKMQKERNRLENKDNSIQEAERRKKTAEAEIKEIELAIIQKSVLERDQVVRDLEKVFGSIKNHLLAMGTKIAPIVQKEKAIKVIKSKIDKEVKKTLIELTKIKI